MQLISKLKERQSWCPYCGGEYVHNQDCAINGLWFDHDTERESFNKIREEFFPEELDDLR